MECLVDYGGFLGALDYHGSISKASLAGWVHKDSLGKAANSKQTKAVQDAASALVQAVYPKSPLQSLDTTASISADSFEQNDSKLLGFEVATDLSVLFWPVKSCL